MKKHEHRAERDGQQVTCGVIRPFDFLSFLLVCDVVCLCACVLVCVFQIRKIGTIACCWIATATIKSIVLILWLA